jgi:FlaG/FlaF family flagellin (archaellin)
MRFKPSDEDAVAPIIAVILVVAVVVILAATLSIFVLQISEQVSDPAR